MSTTELRAVELLLERMLPDPKGFAERVFDQLVERLTADVPQSPPPATTSPAYDSTASEVLSDRNTLFAAAVGACECWGEDPRCPICSGHGAPGWTEPDLRLYSEYVEPAVLRSAEQEPARDATPDEPPKEGVRE